MRQLLRVTQTILAYVPPPPPDLSLRAGIPLRRAAETRVHKMETRNKQLQTELLATITSAEKRYELLAEENRTIRAELELARVRLKDSEAVGDLSLF